MSVYLFVFFHYRQLPALMAQNFTMQRVLSAHEANTVTALVMRFAWNAHQELPQLETPLLLPHSVPKVRLAQILMSFTHFHEVSQTQICRFLAQCFQRKSNHKSVRLSQCFQGKSNAHLNAYPTVFQSKSHTNLTVFHTVFLRSVKHKSDCFSRSQD